MRSLFTYVYRLDIASNRRRDWPCRYAVLLAVPLLAGLLLLPNRLLEAQGIGPVVVSKSSGPVVPSHTNAPDRQASTQTISLDVRDSTVLYVLRALAQQADVRLSYNQGLPDLSKRTTVRIVKATVMDAFALALKGTSLVATRTSSGETVIIRAAASQDANAVGTITGRIIDSSTGKAIEGVRVAVKGTNRSVLTDPEGRFSVPLVSEGQHVLVFTMIGYKTANHTVTVTSGKTTNVQITLIVAPSVLSGVVTTATGPQQRAMVGNDIATINVQEVLRTAPVSNLSELLASRVPGVVVQKASGVPGAPSVIRIRGTRSLALNNDPVLIVDGVRIYSTVTGPDEGSPIPGGMGPSAFDRIDMNSVETVEVLRGPSAAALYGSDASNGVIIVTTRRGKSGPTRWNTTIAHGTNTLPGQYPQVYRLWGRNLEGRPISCQTGWTSTSGGPRCVAYDSLISFQILNDERTTLFGRGWDNHYTFSVDGGSNTVQYGVTVTSRGEIGYQKLPQADVERLERLTGRSVPDWQRRPARSSFQSGRTTMTVHLHPTAFVTFGSTLQRDVVQTTPLVAAIYAYMDQPDPSDSLMTYSKVPHYRMRGEDRTNSAIFSVQTQWAPRSYLQLRGTLGWDRREGNAESLLRNGECPTCAGAPILNLAPRNDLGAFKSNRYNSNVISADASVTVRWLQWGVLSGPTIAGFNYQQEERSNIAIEAKELAIGGNSFVGANVIEPTGKSSDKRVAGLFINQTVTLFNRFGTDFGFRTDAGSGIGRNARAPVFPKLQFAFPLITGENPWHGVTAFRLRTAFGHSGKQPDITMRLRTFEPVQTVPGGSTPGFGLSTIGNAALRPERSVELEGGFDLGLWDDRISIILTGARIMTRDLLINVDVPLSVHGGLSQQRNVGDVLNQSFEMTLDARILDTRLVQWGINTMMNASRNRLVRISKEMAGSSGVGRVIPSGGSGGQLNVEGYPLNGYWTRPLVSYEDVNRNGLLEYGEFLLSDSAVFVGTQQPKFSGAIGSSIHLFNTALNLTTRFDYEYGRLQRGGRSLGVGNRILNDPNSSMFARALLLSNVASIANVSSLRWNEVALSALMPSRVRRLFHANIMRVSLKGQNLRLWTNYDGDPNVRSITNEFPYDDGRQIPPARKWVLEFYLSR